MLNPVESQQFGGSNTLYKLLNEYYYGALDGTGTDYCYGASITGKISCDYTTIGLDVNSYYEKMIKNVYWDTGACNGVGTASATYTNEITTRSVGGYIGLMSASDYGYAASSSYHSTSMNSYNDATIIGTNWLYGQGYEWTINRYDASTSIHVRNIGKVDTNSPDVGYTIRPVVYLDSSIYIISGNGSITNPYIIGM